MKLIKHLPVTAALVFVAAPVFAMPIIDVDFDGNPLPLSAQLFGTAQVRGADGNPGGYLSLTDLDGSSSSSVIFEQFGGGPLTDFKFSVDVRMGAGTDRPADGISVNIARQGDPVLDDGNGFASNSEEEGTTTGLAIGLDEWDNGGTDVVGVSIRIDDVIVDQISLPTLNGALADTTSLQTGPNGQGLAALGWAELAMMLTIDQVLTISWKGAEVYNDTIAMAPIDAGSLVIGARTGGANSHHHVDNISFMGNIAANVPEPPTAALLLIAVFGMAGLTARRRAAA